jgi:uncharacterized membrane protein
MPHDRSACELFPPRSGGRACLASSLRLTASRNVLESEGEDFVSITPVPTLTGSGPTLTLAVLIIAFLLVLVFVLLITRRRRRVSAESVALKQLGELNSQVKASVKRRPPIRHTFRAAVNSKAKFDRFDLPDLMARNIIDSELWFQQEIASRVDAGRLFTAYGHDFDALASRWLGKSTHPRVSVKHFAAIERKTFLRRKLACPVPKAKIRTTVSYTSPKGKNSYSRRLDWNFDQLNAGMQTAQEARTHQSTQEFLRQRERSLMTSSLRVKILRRDGSRCRMCGASVANGAILHVDHIIPVSRGGRTIPENLQALCDSCNLGKSNRFIG